MRGEKLLFALIRNTALVKVIIVHRLFSPRNASMSPKRQSTDPRHRTICLATVAPAYCWPLFLLSIKLPPMPSLQLRLGRNLGPPLVAA